MYSLLIHLKIRPPAQFLLGKISRFMHLCLKGNWSEDVASLFCLKIKFYKIKASIVFHQCCYLSLSHFQGVRNHLKQSYMESFHRIFQHVNQQFGNVFCGKVLFSCSYVEIIETKMLIQENVFKLDRKKKKT